MLHTFGQQPIKQFVKSNLLVFHAIVFFKMLPFLVAAEHSNDADLIKSMLSPLEIPKDYRISLFASEPHALNPIAISVDEGGRVYLAETDRYRDAVFDVVTQKPEWLSEDLSFRSVQDRTEFLKREFRDNLTPLTRGLERVRLLEDQNGDGIAETFQVLAEGFNSIPAGPAAGILAHRGRVWFQCVPTLWRIDWDPKSHDVHSMRALHQGFGVHVGVSGHDLHGITWGPEGRLYFSMGDRGFHVRTETGFLSYPDTGAVLRCEPDGSNLEVVAYGLRNPQEIVFDEFGNLFAGDNDTSGKDKSRVLHIISHGDYGWRCSYQHMKEFGPWVLDEFWKGDIDDLLPSSGYVSQGPSGFAFHPESGANTQVPGPFFICDFPGGIRSFNVQPQGASFITSENQKWLWNVWPTDLAFGPDGALYVSDWVEGWSQPEKGRVYRITPSDPSSALLGADVRPLIASLDSMDSPEEIATFLAHSNRMVRREAQFRLVDIGVHSAPVMLDVLETQKSPLARLHAIWGLDQLGRRYGTSSSTVKTRAAQAGLTDSHHAVRLATLKWLADASDFNHIGAVIALLEGSNPSVIVHALITLGEWMSEPGFFELAPVKSDLLSKVQHKLERVNLQGDAHLRHGFHFFFSQCIQYGRPELSVLNDWIHHPSVSVRMAILQAFRRTGRAEVAAFLHDDDLKVQESAVRAIYDARIDESLAKLVAWKPIGKVSEGTLRRWLWAHEAVGGQSNLKRLFRFVIETQPEVNDLSASALTIALDVIKGWGEARSLDPVTGLWRPAPSRESHLVNELAVQQQAALLKVPSKSFLLDLIPWFIDRNQMESIEPLAALVADVERDEEVRAVALDALMRLDSAQRSSWFQFGLNSPLDSLRTVALSSIEDVKDESLLPRLLEWVKPNYDLRLRQSVVLAIGRLDSDLARQTVSEWWLAMLREDFPNALKLELFEVVQRSSDPVLLSLWQDYRAKFEEKPDPVHLPEVLYGGDVVRGRDLFRNRAEIACLRCHIAEGQGGIVGPALDGLSQRLNRKQILEAVLDPNASIAPGYAAERFVMHDEEEYSGIVVQENASEIIIRQGDGTERTITRKDIQERLTTLSAMPEGVAAALKHRELRDLMAYLGSL